MTLNHVAHKLTRRTVTLCLMLLAFGSALGFAGWSHTGLRAAVMASTANARSLRAATMPTYNPPTVTKAFSPSTILIGGTSTVSLTLNNNNPQGVIAAFSDNLQGGIVAAGGSAGGTCATLAGNTFAANATNLSFTGVVIPAQINGVNGSCTVTFQVKGTAVGTNLPNTTSGVTTDQSATPGPVSNTATLTVNAPTIEKSFDPTNILLGEVSTVTLDLSNPSPVGVIASFTDTLTGMVAVGGPAGGTCATLAGNTFMPGATNLNFTGVVIPAKINGVNGSCWVTFQVKGMTAGTLTNTTSGITTDQTPLAGPPSNTATHDVKAVTVAKAFNPANISSGGMSTVSLTLTNPASTSVLASFSDVLTNMTAAGGPVGGTCASLSGNSFTAGATNLNFNGVVVPASGSCTVTFDVTSTTPGTHPNTTSGVIINSSGVAGPVSNTATLTLGNNLVPTIDIAGLTPSSVAAGNPGFTLIVKGTNFVSSSKVRWNGLSLPTTFVSATQLAASITADRVFNPGTATITVQNLPPGGGTSNGIIFTIN